MIEEWFSADAARYFSLLALFALLACLQPLAERGKAKRLVVGSYVAATGLAVLLFIAGIVALLMAQPSHVYGALMFSGGLTAVLLAYYDWKVFQTYHEADLHRSVASDL